MCAWLEGYPFFQDLDSSKMNLHLEFTCGQASANQTLFLPLKG
jgi:hypothetical protein